MVGLGLEHDGTRARRRRVRRGVIGVLAALFLVGSGSGVSMAGTPTSTTTTTTTTIPAEPPTAAEPTATSTSQPPTTLTVPNDTAAPPAAADAVGPDDFAVGPLAIGDATMDVRIDPASPTVNGGSQPFTEPFNYVINYSCHDAPCTSVELRLPLPEIEGASSLPATPCPAARRRRSLAAGTARIWCSTRRTSGSARASP